MADCAFNTSICRRAILAGGTAAIAAPAFGIPAGLSAGVAAGGEPDALPGPDANFNPDPDPDAVLLRRMALASRRRADYEATRAAWARGFDAMVAHPDYPDMAALRTVTDGVRVRWADLARQTGYAAAAERRNAAHARYVAAANTAFAIPARSLRGLCVKMRFAVAALRAGGEADSAEQGWLRLALADLERLAAEAAHG